MYKKIVVGYDGSEQAEDALALGKELAALTGAELILSSVVVAHPLLRGGLDPLALEGQAEVDEGVRAAASEAGAEARNVESSSVARGLHELAEEAGADLLVVGSSRHGKAEQTLLGNVAISLLHGSSCAVAVAPRGYRDKPSQPVSRIVVAYDGSPESQLALEAGTELARASGGRLRLVCAAEPPPVVYGKSGLMSGGWEDLREAIEAEAAERLGAGRRSLPADVAAEAAVIADEPTKALVNEARAPGTILMVGSRAYGPVRRVLLGSVSRALADSSPSPLVIHPRGARSEPTAETPEAAGTAA